MNEMRVSYRRTVPIRDFETITLELEKTFDDTDMDAYPEKLEMIMRAVDAQAERQQSLLKAKERKAKFDAQGEDLGA